MVKLSDFSFLFAIFFRKNQKFKKILQKSDNFTEILQNLQKFANNLKIQLAHFVDLEKCCKMSIWLQKSALIQPRTSPPKFAPFGSFWILSGP